MTDDRRLLDATGSSGTVDCSNVHTLSETTRKAVRDKNSRELVVEAC